MKLSEIQKKVQNEACNAWFEDQEDIFECSNDNCDGNHKTVLTNITWSYEGTDDEEYEHIIDVEITWKITVKESYKT